MLSSSSQQSPDGNHCLRQKQILTSAARAKMRMHVIGGSGTVKSIPAQIRNAKVAVIHFVLRREGFMPKPGRFSRPRFGIHAFQLRCLF